VIAISGRDYTIINLRRQGQCKIFKSVHLSEEKENKKEKNIDANSRKERLF